MTEEWTSEDEATFRPLKRKYDRIHKKGSRDKNRKRPFKPRLPSNCEKTIAEKKYWFQTEMVKYKQAGYCPYGFEGCSEKVCIENCQKVKDWLNETHRAYKEQPCYVDKCLHQREGSYCFYCIYPKQLYELCVQKIVPNNKANGSLP